MMKKVILMGLSDEENIGDQFMPKCVQYLVSENEAWESQLISLIPPKRGVKYLIYGGLKVITKVLPECNFSYYVSYVANKIRMWKYYRKAISEADAIIFSLGSYKYTTQDSWAHYILVIQMAEKKHIPVMFNAMNIQDFDEADWRCRVLKEYTNYSCVKVFTTRDGLSGVKELKKYYITNSNIKVSAVGDVAYWIPECYKVKKDGGNKIGVNLIRSGIFADYGKKTTKEKLFSFYMDLITRLNENNVQWELFTNGMQSDLEFGKELLARMGKENGVSIRVPATDEELTQIIGRYKGIIGARLHACICAYSLDVPVVGFIWDKKILRFSQVSKLERFFLKEEELDADLMLERLNEALEYVCDKDLRISLKIETQKTINAFLEEI